MADVLADAAASGEGSGGSKKAEVIGVGSKPTQLLSS